MSKERGKKNRNGVENSGVYEVCGTHTMGKARRAQSRTRVLLYASIQAVNARLEALYYLANATHFVEFHLELVDFAQYGAEARDFGVGHLHCVTRAVVLHLGCGLCLLGQLWTNALALVSRTISSNLMSSERGYVGRG